LRISQEFHFDSFLIFEYLKKSISIPKNQSNDRKGNKNNNPTSCISTFRKTHKVIFEV